MFERPEFAKLSVVGSAKELQKHIETTYPDSSEYEGIIIHSETYKKFKNNSRHIWKLIIERKT